MEAEKTMFTPLNVKLQQMIQEGTIGRLQAIRAEYCYDVLSEVKATHWAFWKGTKAYLHKDEMVEEIIRVIEKAAQKNIIKRLEG